MSSKKIITISLSLLLGSNVHAQDDVKSMCANEASTSQMMFEYSLKNHSAYDQLIEGMASSLNKTSNTQYGDATIQLINETKEHWSNVMFGEVLFRDCMNQSYNVFSDNQKIIRFKSCELYPQGTKLTECVVGKI
jgi:hypothetical protein